MKNMIAMMNAMKFYKHNDLVNDSDALQEKLSQDLNPRAYRKMIDRITEKVTTPFEALMNLYLFSQAGATGASNAEFKLLYQVFAADAKKNSGTTLRSTYDAQRDVLQTKLEELYAKFNGLE